MIDETRITIKINPTAIEIKGATNTDRMLTNFHLNTASRINRRLAKRESHNIILSFIILIVAG